jgi:ATP-dependent protease ClpP protease subunit
MAEILIYDDIGPEEWGGVSAKAVKAQLDAMPDADQIVVRINSPGGDVFDGFAIYNLLKQHPAHITVKVDGMAASAASVIAMAGDTIEMASNARMMIHNPWTLAVGDSAEMRKKAELLDQIKESIVATYKARVKMEEADIAEAMDSEWWFGAKAAIEHGFADAESGAAKAIKNTAKPWIRNAPVEPIAPEPPAVPEFRIAARQRFPIS